MRLNEPDSHTPVFLNRRKSARWRVRIPISLSDGNRTDGMMHNLSATGCAIESKCPYQTGEAVLLRFVLPTGGAVILQAQIRWTSSEFWGVEFWSGQDEAQGQVCAYLESLPRPS